MELLVHSMKPCFTAAVYISSVKAGERKLVLLITGIPDEIPDGKT
jgi:hypothetical protein